MEYSYEECEKLVLTKLGSLGVPEEHAKAVSEVLLEAELRGDPSHGLSCLAKVLKALDSGDLVAGKDVSLLHEEGAITLMDGKNVLGPYAALKAADKAIEIAKKMRVGVVSLRESHHLFAVGYYTRYIANKGFVSFLATSTAPAMAVPGGVTKLLGTNPLAFGAPSSTIPLVIDMSSTVVARGTIREAQKKGEKIPLTWAYDPEGKPTDDPEVALKGSLQAIGNYKGFLLALIIDILASVLSGSAYAKHIFGTSMHANDENKETKFKGDFLLVLDIEKFMPLEPFKKRMDELYQFIREDGGRIPGEAALQGKGKKIHVSEKVMALLS